LPAPLGLQLARLQVDQKIDLPGLEGIATESAASQVTHQPEESIAHQFQFDDIIRRHP